ncbi:carbohydrate-binding protein [Rhizosphaericola mali]|uniref:alpha-L-fucosidase n=2 Tax=Rhizosphaericola mali TaxID=2545455 RepID=A0A5P2G724_9BACT|nr:carbohydrate-binding protein [Rhizosphaericola mali]
MRKIILCLCLFLTFLNMNAQKVYNSPEKKSLQELQQAFIDLKFGMFIHFNIPTYANQDWPDPDMPAATFNPTKLDCDQWAKAAKSAHMTYGCLTTKHHSGFCIWDTKTTNYSVMNSSFKKDVVKEYVNAFRKNGLKVSLYYSILDTHHRIRPNNINKQSIVFIKAQLKELLTNYGTIDALIFDGWDAPWSRISYDDISFQEIYNWVKKWQPNCLVMDLNSAKYPAGALFYSDIKSYEQNAGQMISKETNKLPALSCLPLQENWFWKTTFPSSTLKSPEFLIKDNLVPFNNAYCNFLLNVAPNKEGLIDKNALDALQKMGELWQDDKKYQALPKQDAPIISRNLAKDKFAESSWSDDMNIMDFGNDDKFNTSWESNPEIKNPWYEVVLGKDISFNTIVITEGGEPKITNYTLEIYTHGQWKKLIDGNNKQKTKLIRFPNTKGDKVRMKINEYNSTPSIAEFGIYNEPKL